MKKNGFTLIGPRRCITWWTASLSGTAWGRWPFLGWP